MPASHRGHGRHLPDRHGLEEGAATATCADALKDRDCGSEEKVVVAWRAAENCIENALPQISSPGH